MSRKYMFSLCVIGSSIAGFISASPNAGPVCFGIIVGGGSCLAGHWFENR